MYFLRKFFFGKITSRQLLPSVSFERSISLSSATPLSPGETKLGEKLDDLRCNVKAVPDGDPLIGR